MEMRTVEPAAAEKAAEARPALPASVRVTAVQFALSACETRAAFYARIERFAAAAAAYESDFVVFPEHFTFAMLPSEGRMLAPAEAMDAMSGYTEELVETLRTIARRHRINIIGGSHATRTAGGAIRNVCHVALRDGTVHAREKLHPTPDERAVWGITGGDSIDVIETDCGPIGVMICYDSEFPELSRRLVDQGARLFFVPYCTDTRHGHLRVKYCCQARAVENQVYVVTAGTVGHLDGVENMDIQYAQSALLTPCDMPFARDGIAAETSENVEMVAVADLDLARLDWAREKGAVRNLADRRPDLYHTVWTGAEGPG